MSSHKAGFVSIIGKPNVGKSTLLNALMGYKLVITNPKAQTTRHRILGIVNGEDYQIVFSDTPGILKPAYKLQKAMMKFVDGSIEDGDVVVLLIEAGQKEIGEEVTERLKKTTSPILLVINKIDLLSQENLFELISFWHEKEISKYIVPISALNSFSINELKDLIVSLLPIGEAYYDKTQLTDKPERFFASEIIREKMLTRYKKEIPYSCEVIVHTFKEEEKIIRISVDILVERESQKGIVIGPKGSALKNVGIAARKDLENFFDKQVFLEMFVKVREKWRDDDKKLKELGYDLT